MPNPFDSTACKNLSCGFDGRTVRLSPGQTRQLRDAFEQLRFINTVRGRGGGGVEDVPRESLGALRARWTRGGYAAEDIAALGLPDAGGAEALRKAPAAGHPSVLLIPDGVMSERVRE
jgi:hypothetical protein